MWLKTGLLSRKSTSAGACLKTISEWWSLRSWSTLFSATIVKDRMVRSITIRTSSCWMRIIVSIWTVFSRRSSKWSNSTKSRCQCTLGRSSGRAKMSIPTLLQIQNRLNLHRICPPRWLKARNKCTGWRHRSWGRSRSIQHKKVLYPSTWPPRMTLKSNCKSRWARTRTSQKSRTTRRQRRWNSCTSPR